MEGKEPDRQVIQHELVHNAWATIPQTVIDRAVRTAQDDGEKLFHYAMKRKLDPQPDDDYDRVDRIILKRLFSGIRRANDKQFSLELDLMLPSSDLPRIAERLGIKIKDAQYLTIAAHAFVAKKGGYTLPNQYAEEEVLAYQAMNDDGLAADAFRYHFDAPNSPRAYHPVLDRWRNKWHVQSVGNGRMPPQSILPFNDAQHETWEGALEATRRANEAAWAQLQSEMAQDGLEPEPWKPQSQTGWRL
jgi:hypothetical protein